jgi:hypothetical protein
MTMRMLRWSPTINLMNSSREEDCSWHAPKPDIASVEAFVRRHCVVRFGRKGRCRDRIYSDGRATCGTKIELLGPLPSAIQDSTKYTIGLVATGKHKRQERR